MNISTALAEAKANHEKAVADFNELKQEQQNLAQREQILLSELLRLEGELRLLARLSNDGQLGTD